MPVNVYELLRKLVEARPWSDAERSDALKLLTDMEHMSVLGTMAGQLREQNHECIPVDVWFPGSRQCKICGGVIEPPEHSCVPGEWESSSTGWGRPSVAIKCRICGRAME